MGIKYITPDVSRSQPTSRALSQPARICQDLATIIKSDKIPGKDYYIVDVRDDDWHGGNIKGSQNSPSHGFLLKVDQLVTDTKDVPLVVFHCTYSQVRYASRSFVLELLFMAVVASLEVQKQQGYVYCAV